MTRRYNNDGFGVNSIVCLLTTFLRFVLHRGIDRLHKVELALKRYTLVSLGSAIQESLRIRL